MGCVQHLLLVGRPLLLEWYLRWLLCMWNVILYSTTFTAINL